MINKLINAVLDTKCDVIKRTCQEPRIIVYVTREYWWECMREINPYSRDVMMYNARTGARTLMGYPVYCIDNHDKRHPDFVIHVEGRP